MKCVCAVRFRQLLLFTLFFISNVILETETDILENSKVFHFFTNSFSTFPIHQFDFILVGSIRGTKLYVSSSLSDVCSMLVLMITTGTMHNALYSSNFKREFQLASENSSLLCSLGLGPTRVPELCEPCPRLWENYFNI
jgi:hypothetical protein